MSERAPIHHGEHLKSPENSVEHEPTRQERHEHGEHQPKSPELSVEKIKHTIEQEAVSGKEMGHSESHHRRDHDATPVSSDLKKLRLSRTLTSVRKELNTADRLLSKIVHQPLVDSVSNAVGTTITRPSGVIGGGIVGLFGTSTLLWMSKHYGFQYNYLMVVVLFAIGFIVGVGVELLLKALHKRK